MSAFQPQEDTFHSKLDFALWRRLFQRACTYRKRVIILFIGAIVAAIADAAFALITKAAIDDVVLHGANALWDYAWMYVAVTTVLAIDIWFFIMYAGGLATSMSHDIRRDAFHRLQELEFSFYDTRPVGWLISRLTSDCDRLSRIIAWGFLDLVWGFCLITMISIILLVMHWQLGLIVLAALVPIIGISRYFQKQILLNSREGRKYNSQITASFNEAMMGIRTTKTLVREAENLREFQTLSQNLFAAAYKTALQSAVYYPLVMTLGALAGGLALWRGGVAVSGGFLTLGALVAFINYAGQFFNPINQIARILTEMQGAQAAGERVISLLDTKPAIVDSPEVKARMDAHKTAMANGEIPGEDAAILGLDGYPDAIETIEFRDVTFAYATGEPVLRNFNLTVHAGERIALVGPSGGGKSTIVSLVCRFYEPTSGQILINGVDYRQRSLAWLQSKLGIVLQTPHLFGGTVRENIRYGRLEATDAEVESAARLVNADGFIRALEKGYDSDVGEGGNRLSTGQKQLLSFARALIANPRIFVMDEATSSIDTETEQLIQKGLETIFTGRISFVIAHRLSTIRNATRILVIQKGQIEESGTHDALIHKRGHYYSLYTNQYKREKEETVLESAGAG
ncbi:MAG: ABC transporter ATP-binding protein [Verrucomicrobiota bacterium]|nr:ABC transporter ATP-binding protein [Verrucomicrobiota bacterium]